MDSYQDILYRRRPISADHRPMSGIDRAAQFAPFEALTGLEEQLQRAYRAFFCTQSALE